MIQSEIRLKKKIIILKQIRNNIKKWTFKNKKSYISYLLVIYQTYSILCSETCWW